MRRSTRWPAVVAGLVCLAGVSAPVAAQAAPVPERSDAVAAFPEPATVIFHSPIYYGPAYNSGIKDWAYNGLKVIMFCEDRTYNTVNILYDGKAGWIHEDYLDKRTANVC